MRRIKKDDMVKIIAGKDNGKQGKVLSFNPETNKVVVEGCNMVTKHQKPTQAGMQGGILHKEAPIDASNVMLVVDGQATRVGFQVVDGKKVRVAKKTGKVVD
jgi:large subunit ribosomal protein L24